MPKLIVYCGLLAALAVAMPAVGAQQLSLDKCQQLKDDIARYTEMRRSGGPSAQMDAWKRARRERERQFRHGNCRYYRFQLE